MLTVFSLRGFAAFLKNDTDTAFGRAQLPIMHTIITKSLFGAVVMPTILASTLTTNPAMVDLTTSSNTISIQNILNTVDDTKENIEEDEATKIRTQTAAKIDAYFAKKKMKLAGQGMAMVIASEKYGLDPYLMAAIATKETTGGNFACPETAKRTGDIRYTYNVFGWGSCKIKFESYESGFETIAKNLTGNNPNTAKHYSGKDTVSILESYNPRHVVADYPEQIIAIMKTIEKTSITTEIAMGK